MRRRPEQPAERQISIIGGTGMGAVVMAIIGAIAGYGSGGVPGIGVGVVVGVIGGALFGTIVALVLNMPGKPNTEHRH